MATGSAIMPTPSSITTPPSTFPKGVIRYDVAISHRCQGGERPPGGFWNGVELVRLNVALEQVHSGRGEQQQNENYEQRDGQRAKLIGNDAAERLQRWRVAQEDEQAIPWWSCSGASGAALWLAVRCRACGRRAALGRDTCRDRFDRLIGARAIGTARLS